jgi:hypothetical protein
MKVSKGNGQTAAVFSVLFIGLTLVGCSRREGLPTAEDTPIADQHLPFEGTSDKDGVFPTGSLTPTAIPAGTPVTVHLQSSLSSATSRSGDSFEAVLEEPIIVRGQMVAPRGAIVAGKVLDARASDQLEESGYMRLALTAISLSGKSLPIQTSSIFVKHGSHEKRHPKVIGGAPMTTAAISPASSRRLSGSSKSVLIGASTRTVAVSEPVYEENSDVGVTPERRLTFRLAQPLPLEF